jgi:tripartite-type tricarboxylate transporter receptor subunit TctC
MVRLGRSVSVLRRTLLAAVAIFLLSLGALAQTGPEAWPERPVRLLVGFAPGGTADILARKLQTPLSTRLGKPVIIENRPGASGMTAAAEVARAGAEGHTFALVVSTHASLQAINRKLPYDTEKDFAPVVFVGSIPLVLMINPKSPIRTLPELVAAAKAKPGTLNYGMPGVGLSHHFAGELLKQQAGIDIVAVSYRGTAPALGDVIAGQVDMTFGTLPAVMGAIGGGLVRPLAITSPQRAEGLPDVPTVSELGYPGFDVSEWFGVVAPVATPPAVVARLNAEINAVLGEPDVQEWLKQNNVIRGPTTPKGFQELVASEIAKLTIIAQKSRISVE